MTLDGFDAPAFATAFQQFLHEFHHLARTDDGAVRRLLVEHLGRDPQGLPVLSQRLDRAAHPNLQLALDRAVAADPASRVLGLPVHLRHHYGFSLGALAGGGSRDLGPIDPTAVEYLNLPIGLDRVLPCAQVALFLLRHDGQPLVALVLVGEEHGPMSSISLEVLAEDQDLAAAFLAAVKAAMHELDVYRGKVLSFEHTEYGGFGLTFHRLPVVTRDDVILPEADLAAVELHTAGIADRAGELRAAGRHLRRGLLLYGPPGSGKTLTVMYLCNRMPDRTTVLLSGPAIGALGQAAAIARSLQPSMLVLEDVDLIAHDRMLAHLGTNPLLFQLLNEMDGLDEDADVVFVLTTNRVQLLEPALAARPGRIDQAVEIKLPDHPCRERLLRRYLTGVATDVDAEQLTEVAGATEGVSAAFIRELVRRATMLALDDASPPVVSAAHLRGALTDLLEHSTPVVRSLLGAALDGTAPWEDVEPMAVDEGGWSPAPWTGGAPFEP